LSYSIITQGRSNPSAKSKQTRRRLQRANVAKTEGTAIPG
jgi:hypothetical protein